MAKAIADKISQLYPQNKAYYQQNVLRFAQRSAQLKTAIEAQLAPVKKQPFLVFHDAYQYFEKEFGLNALGSVIVINEQSMGVKHLREIHRMIQQKNVRCVLSESQFSSKYADSLSAKHNINTVVIDPLGKALPANADLYFILMRQLAEKITQCLQA